MRCTITLFDSKPRRRPITSFVSRPLSYHGFIALLHCPTESLFNGFTLQSCCKICFSVIVWGFSHSSTSPLTVQINIRILVHSHFKVLTSFFLNVWVFLSWKILCGNYSENCCDLSSYIWLFWRFHVLTRDRHLLFCAIFTYLNNHCSIFLIFPF